MSKELGVVITLKLLALIMLWTCFFSGENRLRPSQSQFTEQFIGYNEHE